MYNNNNFSFSFESCFILKSAKGLNNVEIKSRIDAETFQENRKYSRVWFKKHKNLNETRHSYIDSYVKISEGKTKYCQTETAYIKNNTRDILNPIKVPIFPVLTCFNYRPFLHYIVPSAIQSIERRGEFANTESNVQVRF